jgi:serine acetyltransferase
VSGSPRVPPRTTALGVPARIRQEPPDAEKIRINAERYVEKARQCRAGLTRTVP